MLLICSGGEPQSAFPLDITPFQTFNQSPLIQIYGLPTAEPATTMQSGRLGTKFSCDMANNFAIDHTNNESITLDGETYRITFAGRYGITDKFEVGIDIPFLVETGGIFDPAVAWFHHIFGLGMDGRDDVPENRLLFNYTRNGVERINIQHGNDGFGDVRLLGAYQLYRDDHTQPRAVALRACLKLPTGESGELHGSGGTDFALWLSAADEYITSFIGHWGIYGSLGGIYVSKGDILPDLQRNLVAFGTVGIGWSPAEWAVVKLQVNGNSPFYYNSELRELDEKSLQTLLGSTFELCRDTELDVSISEHILAIATSPDFGFQVALRKMF
jgi:hypothetical protein